MLQIQSEQMVSLDRGSESVFVDRTAKAVHADYPNWKGAATPDDAHAMVSRIVELLKRHAIIEEAQHVAVVRAFARNDLSWPWPGEALDILAAPLHPSVRVTRLIADADLGTWYRVLITASTDVPVLLAAMAARHA